MREISSDPVYRTKVITLAKEQMPDPVVYRIMIFAADILTSKLSFIGK